MNEQRPSNSLVDRAWLLETNWGPYIHYFGPQGGVRRRGGGHIGTEPHEFTRDVNRATLFRTKEDAEQFLQWMQANIRHSWLGWKVTEHEWVAPRASSEPEAERQSYIEADGCPTEMAVLKRFWREHQRASQLPPAVPSMFDLAFEVMRLMDRQEMDMLQSVHFGYVLRVEREKHTPPPADPHLQDDIEAAYWLFDHKKKGRTPMSERDAFKWVLRGFLAGDRASATKSVAAPWDNHPKNDWSCKCGWINFGPQTKCGSCEAARPARLGFPDRPRDKEADRERLSELIPPASVEPTDEKPAKQCRLGGECGYLDGKGNCIRCGEPHPDAWDEATKRAFYSKPEELYVSGASGETFAVHSKEQK